MEPTLKDIFEAISSEGASWKVGCTEREAEELAEEIITQTPSAAVRIIESWAWLDLRASEQEEKAYAEDGLLTAVLFSHQILRDFTGQMRRGHWICTTPILNLETSWPVLRTKNTSYILVGPGHRRTVDAGVILSILSGALHGA